jgi:porin
MNLARMRAGRLVMIIATIAALMMIAEVARAQGDQEPWWTWPTIDGSWNGYRHRLNDNGIVVSGTNLTDLQGNVSGGQRTGFAAANTLLLAADADFEKLASLSGLLLHAEFVSVEGQNLSSKTLGNVLQVGTAFAQPGYYLGQLYAQQKLFDDKLTLQAGRMTTANNFASLSVFNDYVSFTDNPIPVSLTNNTIYFSSLPAVSWAAVGTLTPSEALTLTAGIYNTNQPSGQPFASRHGLDFSFDGSGGPIEVGQITYNRNNASQDTGLPGTYNLGGYYSGADYQRLAGGGARKGDYGFYFEAEQMVFRDGGVASDTGLTPWFTISYNPERSINQIPLLLLVGAVYHGLIPGRGDDSTAASFYYGELSTASSVVPTSTLLAAARTTSTSSEKVVELDYTCWAMPWFGITPDLQYILNPRGSSSRRNAIVLGLQLQVLL